MPIPEPAEIKPGEAGNTIPAEPGQAPAEPAPVEPPAGEPTPPAPEGGEPSPKAPDAPEYTDNEKQLYARAKKAEDKAKAYKEKFGDLPSEEPAPPQAPAQPSTDPYSLAQQISALKDFDNVEINYAQTLSKALEKSPQDVVQTEEFQLWLSGKRAKDEREAKIPSPTGGGAPSNGMPSSDDIGKMTKEEHAKLEREHQKKMRSKGI